MYEELACWGALLKEGVMSWAEYDGKLDERFDERPEDELLARLEWCGSNRKDALAILLGLMERQDLDLEALGRSVFGRLEEVYRRDDCGIEDFDRLIRAVWWELPEGLRQDDALFPIYWADEALTYNGENQARDVYEAAFRRFHPDAPPYARRDTSGEGRGRRDAGWTSLSRLPTDASCARRDTSGEGCGRRDVGRTSLCRLPTDAPCARRDTSGEGRGRRDAGRASLCGLPTDAPCARRGTSGEGRGRRGILRRLFLRRRER